MKIESPSFTAPMLQDFMDELILVERDAVVARFATASARLRELVAAIPSDPTAGDEAAWQAHEVLAHIAVLSKFYGLLTYKIGTGAMTELDLVGNVNLRDVLGEQVSRQPVAEVAAQVAKDHQRTLDYLRTASAADLRREARLSHGGTMSAGEVARLPLVAHLEQHVRQLEAALTRA